MDAKEPFVNSGIITWAWVIGVSLWGGVVSYFDKKEPFSFISMFAHLSSASFAGLLTFFLCQYGNVPGPLTGVLCGVAAHMGTYGVLNLAMKSKKARTLLGIEEEDIK